jgi:thiol-disulfide isomerase/thioredoxin
LLFAAALADEKVPADGKVVLVELFTSSGCPPCVAADIAADKLLENYSSDEVAFLMYHTHAGYPDPMGSLVSVSRMQLYGARGAPTFVVDGGRKTSSGGGASQAEKLYAIYERGIERRREVSAPLSLQLRGRVEEGTLFLQARLELLDEHLSSSKLVLHVALVERSVSYRGENGVDHHPMVVRAMLNEGRGVDVTWNDESFEIDERFLLADVEADLLAHLEDMEARFAGEVWRGFSRKMHEVDPANLMLVAFVQEARKHEVLQAAGAPVE